MNRKQKIVIRFHLALPTQNKLLSLNDSMVSFPTAPRIFRSDLTKRWARDPLGWSPNELFDASSGSSGLFPPSLSLSVKRAQTSRFFMYEEHAQTKLRDDEGPTKVLAMKPMEFAKVLHESKHKHGYHYWTSPLKDVAPDVLSRLEGYESLHQDQRLLDPRGPSVWTGSCGSATQAHYDVADNVLVQLFGSKRIRCYPPGSAEALHVFPDAHPRARKSQVDFDNPNHVRFPRFSSLPAPFLDIVLRPGDAIQIPAFWFHHVENGRIPSRETTTSSSSKNPHQDIEGDSGDDGPSLSVNIFAMSLPMMAAQRVFQLASRPFGIAKGTGSSFSASALRALGAALVEGIGMEESVEHFVRRNLLESRYLPLQHGVAMAKGGDDSPSFISGRALTNAEGEAAQACVERLLPEFDYIQSVSDETDSDGILRLVALHLLELWAVELVGAKNVANTWNAAISNA